MPLFFLKQGQIKNWVDGHQIWIKNTIGTRWSIKSKCISRDLIGDTKLIWLSLRSSTSTNMLLLKMLILLILMMERETSHKWLLKELWSQLVEDHHIQEFQVTKNSVSPVMISSHLRKHQVKHSLLVPHTLLLNAQVSLVPLGMIPLSWLDLSSLEDLIKIWLTESETIWVSMEPSSSIKQPLLKWRSQTQKEESKLLTNMME